MTYRRSKYKPNRSLSIDEQAGMAILLSVIKKARELAAGNHGTLPQRPVETFQPLSP